VATTPITDWVSRLKSRLYEQFKSLPGWTSIVEAIAARVQALENVAQQVYTITSIDDSEGVQLDVLGRLVGEPRGGKTDALYRLFIRAKVRANRSSGTHEDLYAVLVALFGAGMEAKIAPAYPAGIIVTITAPLLDADDQAAALHFLIIAKAAGVKLWLETSPGDDDDMYTLLDPEHLTDGLQPGLGLSDANDKSFGGQLASAVSS
jgi:hypothetical protein